MLFVSFTNREAISKGDLAKSDEHDIKPFPLARNLSQIYAKYPQYDEASTIMVSNHHNLLEDYQRNDILVPEFHPKMGKTDFLDDKHLFYFHKYLRFMFSLDHAVGVDIRNRMEAFPYDTFIQKLTKSVRYDSYAYSKNIDPEF